MNHRNYIELQAKGFVETFKANNGYALARKIFDTHTGEEQEPEVQAIDLDELRKQKAELQAEIKDIAKIISDCSALDK